MHVIVLPLSRNVRGYIHLLVSQVWSIFVNLLFTFPPHLLVMLIVEIVSMSTQLHLDSFTVFLLSNFFNLVLEFHNVDHTLKLLLEGSLKCILWFRELFLQKLIYGHQFLFIRFNFGLGFG